jgi:hypothetical protein
MVKPGCQVSSGTQNGLGNRVRKNQKKVEKELVGWDVRKSPLDGEARLPGQLWSRRTQDGLRKPEKAEKELVGLDHVCKRLLDGEAGLPGQL